MILALAMKKIGPDERSNYLHVMYCISSHIHGLRTKGVLFL